MRGQVSTAVPCVFCWFCGVLYLSKNVFEDVIANSVKYSVGYSNFASANEFMGNFDGSSSDLWVKCRTS